MRLALPTPEVIDLLSPHKVIECGAGDGLWVTILRHCGINAVGIDPQPRGGGVDAGSHLDLRACSERLLLVVWPPDGTDLNEWVAAWGGRTLMIVGCPDRFTLPEFDVLARADLPHGCKGPSEMLFGVIPSHAPPMPP